MKPNSKPNAEKDLEHFLKLAQAQVRHRSKQVSESGEPSAIETLRALILLEDLIKEQVPNHEDSNSPARSPR